MNRERSTVWSLAAIAAAFAAAPTQAKDAPKPSLSIDSIVARGLLAPVEDGRNPLSNYRLDPGPDPAAGQRARLSLEVGDATVFAITGRLNRQPVASGSLDPGHARVLGQRRDSGKIYGGGISSVIRGVEISGTYQYSKANADQARPDNEAFDNGPGRSHSVKATARIRFKP